MCSARRLSSEERKKEIMTAGGKVFVEKGFSNTSMEDVISQTTMSKGGVYHYYKNTIDILHDLMVEGIKYRNEVIKSYMEDYKEESQVEFLAKRFVEKMIDDNPYMEIYVQFLLEKKRNEKLSSLFEDLKEENRKRISQFIDLSPKYLENQKSYDLITDFINSIIIGADVLEARDNFIKNRELLEKIVVLILKEGGCKNER